MFLAGGAATVGSMHTVCMCSLNVLHQATNEFIWCFLWLASPPNYPAPTLHLGSPSVYFGWPHIASVQYCGYCLVLQAGFWWSFLCNWSAAFWAVLQHHWVENLQSPCVMELGEVALGCRPPPLGQCEYLSQMLATEYFATVLLKEYSAHNVKTTLHYSRSARWNKVDYWCPLFPLVHHNFHGTLIHSTRNGCRWTVSKEASLGISSSWPASGQPT